VDVSVVVPVYQCEACLEELVSRLQRALAGCASTYEILLVEDRGGDNSWAKIKEIASRESAVTGMQLSRNFGQHNALLAGLDRVGGDWVVVMDCDLQDRPEDIPLLLDAAHSGFDVVIARFTERHGSWPNRVMSRAFYRTFSGLSGFQYQDGERSFRVMSRKVVEQVCLMREQMRSIGPLCHWLGFDTLYVDVPFEGRSVGRSSYNPRKLLTVATMAIVAFSERPLRISIWIGTALALVSFMLGLGVVLMTVLGTPPPGWTTIVLPLYFLGGLLLLNMGVLGIYIGRIFDEAKRRPLYVVSETTNSDLLAS
jgi:glycosyltransferase involved in cell wall biosynthesis